MSTTDENILERWNVAPDELTTVLDDNPSVKGMLLGYVGEIKLRDMWFDDERVSEIINPDDHDRSEKADWIITYRGERFYVEVKSLQSNTITKKNGVWHAKSQVDASDSREVTLPNGRELVTTCLVAGEFDLLAVSLFAFEEEWVFAFAKNEDLPRSQYSRYDDEVRQHLLATTVDVTLPIQEPFRGEPYSLLDEMLEDKRGDS